MTVTPLLTLDPAATAFELELMLKARSARKTPTLLSMIPNTARKLENASREDDFCVMSVFIFLSELYSLYSTVIKFYLLWRLSEAEPGVIALLLTFL